MSRRGGVGVYRRLLILVISVLAGCAPASPSAPTLPRISAARFWELYFHDQFLRLERKHDVWRGLARDEPTRGDGPSALLREVKSTSFEITVETLRAYDYGADARFSSISAPPGSVGAAFDAVVKRTYPYHGAAPFGAQRMSELFTLTRSRYRLPGGATLTLTTLEQSLTTMINQRSEELNQHIAALAWFLGERRQRSSSPALLEILWHSSHVRRSQPPVHFTAVDAAYAALWKVNDKARLPELLAVMRASDSAGRQKLARLFERLLSRDVLLSLDNCGDAYFEPDFWAGVIESSRNHAVADWDRYDAGSMFWELRYLAATRVRPEEAETLRQLAGDMVPAVREAAAFRTSNRGG